MERLTRAEENVQKVERLEARISKQVKENTRDLQEMAERGKDIVKLAQLIRGFKDQMPEVVYESLVKVVIGFENRCYVMRSKKKKKD